MEAWRTAIQHILDWMDEHAMENPSLTEISNQVGYSPYYCSELFRKVAGCTIKMYMAKRRLTLAALAIRDTDAPLVDIALDYGFSSQSALARAFVTEFGCTPAAYRKHPQPLPMTSKKIVLLPDHIHRKGGFTMENIVLPSYRMEYIPAHKYLGVYNRCTTSKGDIWPNHDCDLLCGYISSMPSEKTHPIVTGMTAGWAAENGDVMSRVEEMAWSFDPHTIEYEWNEDVCQIYQRHYPEGLGYQVLRPVRKLENK